MIINPFVFGGGGTPVYPSGAKQLFSLHELNGYTGLLFRAFRLLDLSTNDFYIGASDGVWNTVRGGGGTDLATWGAGTNVRITKWYDQSGNANEVGQGTYARMPEIMDSGTVHLVNGQPALKLVGTDTFMDIATPYSAAENFTAFMVGNRSATNKSLFGWSATSYGAYSPLHYSNGKIYSNSRSGDLQSTSTDSTISQSVYTSVMAGASRNLRINAADVAAGFTPSSDSADFEYILGILTGAAEYSDGYVQEMGMWLSDETDNISDIENTANNYFGIW